MTTNIARDQLAASLTQRVATFDVAEAILRLNNPAISGSAALVRLLQQLAAEKRWAYGQMNDDFDRVDSIEDQLATYRALFPQAQGLSTADLIPEALEILGVIDAPEVSAEQALMKRTALDWRLGHATSRKAFTKRLRFLANFEAKLARHADVTALRHAQMQAKSRLAYLVDPAACDDVSLAYIAYLAARANRRSMFMLGGQSKAFDQITDLLRELLTDASAWDQIALVAPMPSVLRRVSAARRGELTGVFHRELTVAARKLGELWPSLPTRMRAEMVMVKGVDSSRWNAYAGALNTMRSAWIAATIASGLEGIFEAYLPGKAPRLMASDLVWWAREAGQDLHEDTRMFAVLPHPWEVVSGTEVQTRSQILAAAEHEQVDAVASGWVGPRTDVVSELTAAEPATVHGIAVFDAHLAQVLRRAGAFSGQGLRAGAELPAVLRVDVPVTAERTVAVALG